MTILFVCGVLTGKAQEKSKKEIKAEKKIEAQRQVEALVHEKKFVFDAQTAIPQGFRSVSLTSGSYHVKFSPEKIESNLPYFGKAYSGAGYGNDPGMSFDGKPEEYTVTKGKKNYSISAIVKGSNDTYRLNLTVGFEGNSTLSVSSNNRSHISYNGEISKTETQPVNK